MPSPVTYNMIKFHEKTFDSFSTPPKPKLSYFYKFRLLFSSASICSNSLCGFHTHVIVLNVVLSIFVLFPRWYLSEKRISGEAHDAPFLESCVRYKHIIQCQLFAESYLVRLYKYKSIILFLVEVNCYNTYTKVKWCIYVTSIILLNSRVWVLIVVCVTLLDIVRVCAVSSSQPWSSHGLLWQASNTCWTVRVRLRHTSGSSLGSPASILLDSLIVPGSLKLEIYSVVAIPQIYKWPGERYFSSVHRFSAGPSVL